MVFTIKIFGYIIVSKKKATFSKLAFGMVIDKVHEKKIPCNSYNLRRILWKKCFILGKCFLCRVKLPSIKTSIDFLLKFSSCDTRWVSWGKVEKNVGCFKEWNARHSGHYVFWNGRKNMLFKVLSDYTRKSMHVFTKFLPYLDNRFQQVAKI